MQSVRSSNAFERTEEHRGYDWGPYPAAQLRR